MSRQGLRRFAASQEGAITPFALLWLMLTLTVGSLAVDVSNAYRERTQMQDAVDATALGAVYLESDPKISVDEARQRAVAVGQANLGQDASSVITPEDVVFGYYDDTNDTFTTTYTAGEALTRAVKVTAHRDAERNNETPTFMARLAGKFGWTIRTSAIAEAYRPKCLTEGLSANGVIDLQSGNTFKSGFCLYARAYVSLNQNNIFEPGSIVSMPDVNNLDIPASGFSRNDGLAEALRNAFYDLRILNQLSTKIDDLRSGAATMPSYITDPSITTISKSKIDTSEFQPGHVYELSCSGSKAHIDGTTIKDAVIFASCPVVFGNGVALENVIFANTSTSDRSFSAPSGLRLGANDSCASGGGVQILTLGGVGSAAKVEFYGSQIIAARDVNFAAQANGVQGISVIAGGKIDGTSNSTFGHCGSGMDSSFDLQYFRLRA
ncbi:TadE/TadG family type IV pilus assembly protein [Thioclava atlantica]|uniref:Aminoacyl-tRNA synthetase class I n=1 Tax=Thioclava atlantica TaxID=1317124 RepID=A0A085TXH1_9RHOB|nr:TadE/TadG family type IV pilus assembly protein [Thioclava atlantica]KFE35418.1 aminoacyl-tRNA synthetase class I [Thioclava atlantica]